MTDDEKRAWDEAVGGACQKVMALQGGFRRLLVSKRAELLKAVTEGVKPDTKQRVASLEAEVSQGEALVGTLGDAIRNIAAMKGNYPR